MLTRNSARRWRRISQRGPIRSRQLKRLLRRRRDLRGRGFFQVASLAITLLLEAYSLYDTLTSEPPEGPPPVLPTTAKDVDNILNELNYPTGEGDYVSSNLAGVDPFAVTGYLATQVIPDLLHSWFGIQ